jgi:chitin disaccharide deacetylase
VKDASFLTRWLSRVPGKVVELTCHPGRHDETLLGRDATETDGQMQRRVDEFTLLSQPSFREVCRQAQFTRVAPRELLDSLYTGAAHAA